MPKAARVRSLSQPRTPHPMHPDPRQAQGKQTKAEAAGDDGGGHFAAAFLAFGLAGAVRARNSSAHSSALPAAKPRSEAHPFELQSHMRRQYAVFCFERN